MMEMTKRTTRMTHSWGPLVTHATDIALTATHPTTICLYQYPALYIFIGCYSRECWLVEAAPQQCSLGLCACQRRPGASLV